jgi:hypothetical protein
MFWLAQVALDTPLYGIFEESAKLSRWPMVVVLELLLDWLVPEPEWRLEEGAE